MSSSYDDIIQENNQDVKIDTVKLSRTKHKLSRMNHASFFVEGTDYHDTKKKDSNKVVCVSCTDQFFNIFFNESRTDDQDEFTQEIFKLKVYMDYYPEEKVYKCPNNPEHIETLKDPQMEMKKEKKIMGAGIESFPEYVSYLDPDTVRGDTIITANSNKKKRKPKPFFYHETEDEVFQRFMNTKRS